MTICRKSASFLFQVTLVIEKANPDTDINTGFDLYAPGSDQWKTQFRAIDCPKVAGINGNIKFRFVESNPWAMKLQTRNSRQVLLNG